jgi:small-conductance mechanosensitive channel
MTLAALAKRLRAIVIGEYVKQTPASDFHLLREIQQASDVLEALAAENAALRDHTVRVEQFNNRQTNTIAALRARIDAALKLCARVDKHELEEVPAEIMSIGALAVTKAIRTALAESKADSDD